MVIVICILFVAAALVLLWNYLKSPAKHKIQSLNDLPRFIDNLCDRFSDGSIMYLTHKKTGYFLQFVLNINKSQKTIHFGFPNAPWSKDIFEKVVAEIKNANKYEFRINPTNVTPTTSFLELDNLTKEDVLDVAKIAFKAMEIAERNEFVVHYKGNLR